MNLAKTYPASKPYRACDDGRCAWSGLPYRRGSLVRRVCDGYDAETRTETNPRIVLERFVNMACYPGNLSYRRVTEDTSAAMLAGTVFYLLRQDGTESPACRYDGDNDVWYYGSTRRNSLLMERTFHRAVAFRTES